MNQVSNILVPINFSKASQTAVQLAVEWSSLLKSNLMLLHTYRLIQKDKMNREDSARGIRESILSNKNEAFNKLQKQIDLSKSFSYNFHLELGFLPSCIARLSNETKIDLITYGLKNEKQDQDLLAIVESRKSPVLVVNENYNLSAGKTFTPLIHSVMANDFIKNASDHITELHENNEATLLVHPSTTKESSPLTKRITDYAKVY